MTLYVGARDPEAISLVITDATFDFAAVTAAQLRTTSPAGFDLPWSWTRTPAAGQITLTHVFSSSAEDLTEAGEYIVVGELLTATSQRRIKPIRFTVRAYR